MEFRNFMKLALGKLCGRCSIPVHDCNRGRDSSECRARLSGIPFKSALATQTSSVFSALRACWRLACF